MSEPNPEAAQSTPNIVGMLDPNTDEMRRDAILKGEQKLTERKIGMEGALARQEEQRSSAYRSRMEGMIAREGASADELHPWNAQQELEQRKTGLWEQFGSPGFVISMLASAFTAQPMNSALNAGAAAMNAINQGDMKSYEKAFEAWKENTELALKRINLEHQQVADLDKLRQTDLAEWRNKREMLALQMGDEKTLFYLKNGLDEELDKADTAKAHAATELNNAFRAKLETDAVMAHLNGHVAQEGEPVTHKDTNGTPMSGGDPRWYNHTDPLAAHSEAIREVQNAKYPYRANLSAAAAQDAPIIKERLSEILGHKISPEMDAVINAAYGAKGVTAAKIVAAVTRAVSGIEADIAAGKTEKEIDPEKRLADAITAASMTGRSGTSLYAQKLQIEHPEWNADQVSHALALYTLTQSRARTLGTRSANIDTAAVEAKKAAVLALNASKAVPRGDWVPINKLKQTIARGTSSPEQRAFDTYNAGLITAYGQTMSRTGANTVTAQNRATDLLSTADGPAAYEAAVNALIADTEIVKDAVREVEGTLDQGSLTQKKKVAIPPAFKDDPDGTTYHKDGETWIKQGNDLVVQ